MTRTGEAAASRQWSVVRNNTEGQLRRDGSWPFVFVRFLFLTTDH
jgi:hypothetical protein